MTNNKRKTIFLAAYTQLNIQAALIKLTKAERDEIEKVKILRSQLNLKILDDEGIVLTSAFWPVIIMAAKGWRLKFAYFSKRKLPA